MNKWRSWSVGDEVSFTIEGPYGTYDASGTVAEVNFSNALVVSDVLFGMRLLVDQSNEHMFSEVKEDNSVENKMVSAGSMLVYLQGMMDDYEEAAELEREIQKKYGGEYDEHMIAHDKMIRMLACRQMIEEMIGIPVNCQKDGKVTVGF